MGFDVPGGKDFNMKHIFVGMLIRFCTGVTATFVRRLGNGSVFGFTDTSRAQWTQAKRDEAWRAIRLA